MYQISFTRILSLLFTFSLCLSCSSLKPTVDTSQSTQQKELAENISLEDIWMSNSFSTQQVRGMNMLKDGQSYAKTLRGKYPSIVKYSFKTGEVVDTIFNGEKHQFSFSSYQLSPNETKVLFATNSERIYRHSTKAHYYIYDKQTNQISQLAEGEKQTYPAFSPDGKKIAYVQKNNLYVKNLENGETTAITTNGKWNERINGMSDWVYEEEFVLTRAFEWSPNSRQIAFFSFDESEVKQFSMEFYGDLYPYQYKFKYPKAGEKNSIVSTFIYNLSNDTTFSIDTGEENDVYYPRLKWTPSGQLVIFTLNRHQNVLKLLKVNHHSGSTILQTSVLLKEENPYYISEDVLDEMQFLPNGTILWTSERDGYKHIYLLNEQGELLQQVTQGPWDVTTLYGYSEAREEVYFRAAKENPLNREVYKINIDGSNLTKLTPNEGTNSAIFTDSFDYFISTFSSVNQPPITTVRDHKGKIVRELTNNTPLKAKVDSLELPQKEFFTFKTVDGTLLNGWMIKPINFDSTKKYPVLFYVYGGPGSQTVVNTWNGSTDWWHTYLTQKGYIIASVDNRGTGARGQEFKKSTYRELGKFEVEDQIAAANYLGSKSFVDSDRLGIWGWSYGGYMSSLALFKGHHTFKTAIAVAPVTNWRYYDTIYTERYMRTPQENASGYDDNSPINHVDKLEGNFMLVHGMGDDNVHFQNTVDLITALNAAGKQYDLAIYPNKNHGIYGGNTRYHLFEKMTNFILEKL